MKQRQFHSYSEDYAVLFYIRLFNFNSRLLTEYFRLALKKLKAQFVSFVKNVFYDVIATLFTEKIYLIYNHYL